MGTMTLNDIVSEGGLQAGDTGKANRATVELKAWLRSQYAGFLWPFLKREVAGQTLALGSTDFTVGAGSGGVTEHIQRVNDPLLIYTTDFKKRQSVRVYTDYGDSPMQPILSGDPYAPTGMPEKCRIVHTGTPGQRRIDFDLKTDRAYLLRISYFIIPTDPGGTDVPLYPNDRTMIQAVKSFILRYDKADNAGEELQILVAQVNEDRLKYGVEVGMNDATLLDPKVFR